MRRGHRGANARLHGDRYLVPRPGSRLAYVCGERFLFSSNSQRVFKVDASTARLWPQIELGISEDQLHALATCENRDGAQICTQLRDAHAIEYLATREGPVRVTSRLIVDLGGTTVGIWFAGKRAHDLLHGMLSHLEVPMRRCDEHLIVLESASRIGLAHHSGEIDWSAFKVSGAAFKLTLTDLALQRIDCLALHAAMVARENAAMLLIGKPGAGKSTLSIALDASHFVLESDDITELRPDGMARAVPLPATAKGGAWSLLTKFRPTLLNSPSFVRPDRKRVRYLPLSSRGTPNAKPVRAIVLLERSAGAEAELKPLGPEEILASLIKGAWSKDRCLSSSAFMALATCLDRATGYRLIYSDLAAATSILEQAWAQSATARALAS